MEPSAILFGAIISDDDYDEVSGLRLLSELNFYVLSLLINVISY